VGVAPSYVRATEESGSVVVINASDLFFEWKKVVKVKLIPRPRR
jgi:hypothetical protein